MNGSALHNESVHCGMILCKMWKEHSKLPYTAAMYSALQVGQARFLQPTNRFVKFFLCQFTISILASVHVALNRSMGYDNEQISQNRLFWQFRHIHMI